MSEIVTGKLIRDVWVVTYSGGGHSVDLYATEQDARKSSGAVIDGYGTPVQAYVVVPLPDTPPDGAQPVFGSVELTSPPWPPKWGEGPTSGWCRRKSDAEVRLWWFTQADEVLVTGAHDGSHYTLSEFAAEFEPI